MTPTDAELKTALAAQAAEEALWTCEEHHGPRGDRTTEEWMRVLATCPTTVARAGALIGPTLPGSEAREVFFRERAMAGARAFAAALSDESAELVEALRPLSALPLPEDGDGTPDEAISGRRLPYVISQDAIRAARQALANARAK